MALNGQKLARSSQVSDSEISRILQGKSRPGWTMRSGSPRAVGVTLDYLADDSLDTEPPQPADHPFARRAQDPRSSPRRSAVREVLTILENIRFLGYEVAMSRLVGGKPIIEIDKEIGRDPCPACRRPAVAAGCHRRVQLATA